MANIVLIGYRGTGKSTVARLLSMKFNWAVVAMDAKLAERAGMPIKDLVASRGWPHFRDIEEALCAELSQTDRQIIDCGGGVVEREANIRGLRKAGTVFWLRAKPETIISRIGGDDQRPSLTGTQSFTDEVIDVLTRRTPLYAALAHVQISVDQRSPAEIAEQIVELFPNPRL